MAVFSQRLGQLMRERGWTQLDAAAKLGVSQALISRYLRGKREPPPRTVAYLADRLGVDAAWLSPSGQLVPGEVKPGSKGKQQIDLSNTAYDMAMKNLKNRWKRSPAARESIRHLIAMLFSTDAEEVLSWLDRK